MKVLDRVKTIENYKLSNQIVIPEGTIGTIQEMEDHNILLQAGINSMIRQTSQGVKDFSEGKTDMTLSQLFVISDLLVQPVTMEELQLADYRYITSKLFHPGNIWSVKIDVDQQGDPVFKSGIIEDYILALSEDDDEIILTFLEDIYNNCKYNTDLQSHKYLVRYLNTFGSYSVIIE